MSKPHEFEVQELFCGYCGERLPDLGDGRTGGCPRCSRRYGVPGSIRRPPPPLIEIEQQAAPQAFAIGRTRFRDPILAALLSAIFPGAGQAYNLDFLKAFLVLITCWLVIPYFLGIFDAYISAERENRWQAIAVRRG